MRFIIISGLSGAGKSQAASMMEDMGFFCVDNLPTELIPKVGSWARRAPASMTGWCW
jgi:UPF0042 nucleotide-binding protein